MGQKYAQSTTTFSPCFHTHVDVVNLKGGFRLFSFSAARQWFSVHLNHVQIVTELARSLSRAAITAWGLTYERILMIRLCSNVSSEKSKCSSSSMVFFILALMASNDEFFCCTKGDEFLERIRYPFLCVCVCLCMCMRVFVHVHACVCTYVDMYVMYL